MNILVTGAKGMLGTDVVPELQSRGHGVVGVDIAELDITDPSAVAELTSDAFGRLDWCVNCAAYTAVDKAESDQDAAMLVNGIAPGYLGRACQMAKIRFLHVSTDFVFDGEADEPYKEESPTGPLGTYGRTKLQGEEAVRASGANALIVRTAWLYGPNGGSFPKTMIKAWLAGKRLSVVSDQTGTPTYTADLARVIADLIERDAEAGIYHASGPTIATWHAFALKAIQAYQHHILDKDGRVTIDRIRTEDWPTPAARPKYSVLSFKKVAALGIEPMCDLDTALSEFVTRLRL